MRRFSQISIALLALVTSGEAARAQSIFDVRIRSAPQFVSYTIDALSQTKISELAIPMFAVLPIANWMTLDVGTSYASARVERTTNGETSTSTISGLTDTQIRMNASIGQDLFVVTAGVNLPTGRSTAHFGELQAATLIGNDFLSFPVPNMGTGFGGTGGIAMARPLGSWNLGLGVSVRRSAAYNPFEQSDGQSQRYQPGDEYRARIGVDHPFGTGNAQIGVTYSRFGDDDIAGSIYNTGDRYVTQAGLSNSLGVGEISVNAWNLYRTAGTLADGSRSTRENISNVLVGYAVPVGEMRIEPTAELRTWSQVDRDMSMLANIGLRLDTRLGPFGVTPSIGYAMGKMASEDATADLTGYRAALMVRIR